MLYVNDITIKIVYSQKEKHAHCQGLRFIHHLELEDTKTPHIPKCPRFVA